MRISEEYEKIGLNIAEYGSSSSILELSQSPMSWRTSFFMWPRGRDGIGSRNRIGGNSLFRYHSAT